MNTAIVFGGYGTFGTLVARELAQAGIMVTVAGRNRRRAEEMARALGAGHGGLAVDLRGEDACATALAGQHVAINCAGSLVDLSTALLQACLRVGCHYVDIAVERDHVAAVRAHDKAFGDAGLSAVYGCSSLPAISGALAALTHQECGTALDGARVTLFIGNRNPKGRSAIASLVRTLGQPIATPQGRVLGFRDREVVHLPPPFGRRAVFNFDSPEYDLLPHLLNVRSVQVKVGFELRLANYGFALLALLGCNSVALAAWLERLGKLLGWLGTSGGAVMTELFYADGSVKRAAMMALRDGQRMAALPCALVARSLCTNAGSPRGAMTAYEALGAECLIDALVTAGFELHRWHCPAGGGRLPRHGEESCRPLQ